VRTLLTLVLALAGAASWGLLAILIALVPPEAPLALAFFYVLLFTAVFASAAVAAYLLDPWLPRPAPPRRRFARALGYAFPPALLIVGAGGLLGLRLLTPLNAALLLAIAVLAEYVAVPKTS
jgi:hypothetical protein